MALYRAVHVSFWEDIMVVDEFEPADKLFFLYLLTNPHTTLCGCYPLSIRQASIELGYPIDTVRILLGKMENTFRLILYDSETKEVLVRNWHKYNWTTSAKFVTGLKKSIDAVKSGKLKAEINRLFAESYTVPDGNSNGTDTVSKPYTDGTDTVGISANSNQLSVNSNQRIAAESKESKNNLGERAAAAFESEITQEENDQLFTEVVKSFTSCGVFLAGSSLEELKGYQDFGMEPEVLAEAAKRAADAGKATWKYARGILQSWAKSNVLTLEDVRREDASYSRKKAAAVAAKGKQGKPLDSSFAPLYDGGAGISGYIGRDEDAATWKPGGVS